MRARAYIHIQKMIASRQLTAGSAVSELAIARDLGISRTPIREAIGQLVAEGLLDQVPNRGAAVVQLRRQDIVELYEIREALEVYAVGKAVRNQVSRGDLEKLQQLADSMLALKQELDKSARSALDGQEMHRLASCDLAFHTLLMRIAMNSRILKVVNETRLMIRIFGIHRDGHTATRIEQIYQHHCEIIESLAHGNRERVMNLVSHHIQASLQERLDEFDHREREASLRETLPEFLDVPAIAD
jgi:DNA-binding GntR family transcriptional regulator